MSAEPIRTVSVAALGRSRFLATLISIVSAVVVAALFVALSGHNPLSTFRAIFEGSGLNWLLPWTSGEAREDAAINLQQTLVIATPLILVGLAVAVPFRAGLFNIGGQGQYLVGLYAAVWIGSSFAGLPGWLHITIAVVAAAACGAALAAVAGLLKAFAGANEVITTIMLNYVAVWVGVFLFGIGGPLQDAAHPSEPLSEAVLEGARLPVFWGDPLLQGAHLGLFVSVAILVVIGVVLARASVGFEIRAVGASLEAARYGGINVGGALVKVMAVAGLCAGVGGALDILGWQFRLAATDVPASTVGFLGIAVALLARNRVGWVLVTGILFAALLSGTSQRNLDPSVFPPALAGYLAIVFQGIIVFAVAANALNLRLPGRVRHLIDSLRPRRAAASGAER